jgi:hypothetical protein
MFLELGLDKREQLSLGHIMTNILAFCYATTAAFS